ncbi:cryptochrome/photolyase family protein [Oligoflexus tunisiensis]|uniref:cryptochrome/photolyase family protein n=1 Tax=Oligoflexus tunisiensis TaxID=708132 RepID=UPI000B010008|nr:deoxyribodipyrimidine photo-lyase [Oligoflexus tunisiensis]
METVDVVWIRHDLRLTDNPALAAGRGRPLVLVFTADGVDLRAMGAASRVYLHHALKAFQKDLRDEYGARLLIRPTFDEALTTITRAVRVERVLWNRSYEPALFDRDHQIEARLKAQGLQPEVYPGSILFEPWDIKNKSGKPFKVFTPFYKTCLARGMTHKPWPKPDRIQSVDHPALQDGVVDALNLLPQGSRWDLELMRSWITTESGWWQAWKDFRETRLPHYPTARDIPAEDGTSRLSAALHFGQISPRSIWADARAQAPSAGTESFLRQMIWREFAITSLFHQPTMDRLPIIAPFQDFPWADEPEQLEAWKSGRTGYPLVDAGLREMLQTGWMHNRVRMIVGSFLIKNLHINWTAGFDFFWDRLVDADRANNAMGWQWVAGCGIDPSPYFRIFNPILQSERFDPEGTYIKRWVPELERIPARWIHSPWKAPEKVRSLATDYPAPIVDFAESRQQALMFHDRIKSGRASSGSWT